MRVVIQRVREAQVTVAGEVSGRIGHGQPVPTGVFGADMQVALVNDGPVTIALDSQQPE